MDDADLIATLIPTDVKKLAETSFCLEHNCDRYRSPAPRIAGAAISDSGSTPGPPSADEDDDQYGFAHRIRLTFAQEPTDPTKGYCFGTDPRVCDVLLRHRGVSRLHFRITFNEQGHLILQDSSTYGTCVSYDGQAKDEVRRHFTWILDQKKDEEKWKLEVHIFGLSFEVKLASHDTCKEKYWANVDRFLQNSRTTIPIGPLGIVSQKTTAQLSQCRTPRQNVVYISERRVGSGSFGEVHKVIDVSTGATYARKQFKRDHSERDEQEKKRQEEAWLANIREEVRFMEENEHEYIVKIMHFIEGPPPFLVMPYFELGNLEDLNRKGPVITRKETVSLLFQTLKALECLHAKDVAHRDLKPDNILVESRYPFSIKVADFGLAKDIDLKTDCGTGKYKAPEVSRGDSSYTVSVDIWSLGVMVLRYSHGWPHQDEQLMTSKSKLTWCDRVVNHARDLEPDSLTKLLTRGMLRINPTERFDARTCLTKGNDLKLFDDVRLDPGGATTTRQAALQRETDNSMNVTTVLPALQSVEEGSSHDDHGQREYSGLEHRLQPGKFGPETQQGGDINCVLVEDPLCRRLEGQPAYAVGIGGKRQRSPAAGSGKNASSRQQTKRQQMDVSPL